MLRKCALRFRRTLSLCRLAMMKSVAVGGESVGRGCRRWRESQDRQIVTENHEAGVSVPMVSQRYHLNVNRAFERWRLFRDAERTAGAGQFAPLVVEAHLGQESGTGRMGSASESVIAED